MLEHHDCPPEVAKRLETAGGLNPFGEPNFRVVWGYNRIVKMTGQWGEDGAIETREVPKYLPSNRWHLEMWRPPSDYGSPETWGKLGEEVIGFMTVDTAGPFPHRGEYELCHTLSTDGTVQGGFVPLYGAVVEKLVQLILAGRDFTLAQRKAAIMQREEREKRARINETEAALLSIRPAFYDTAASFPTGPKNHKVNTGSLWVPPNYRN